MSQLSLAVLIFLAGVTMGAVASHLRDDSKLEFYRRFIEERLQSQFPRM